MKGKPFGYSLSSNILPQQKIFVKCLRAADSIFLLVIIPSSSAAVYDFVYYHKSVFAAKALNPAIVKK